MMTLRAPVLPGTPSRPSRRQFDDEPVSIDTEQLARDLLAALRDGPLMKWELRDRLHVNEAAIVRQLRQLKAAGQVKVVGKVLDKRAWALTAWQPPAPVPRTAYTDRVISKKPKGPADSWWARPNLTREQFNDAQAARERELGRDGSGQVAGVRR